MASVWKGFLIPGKTGKLVVARGTANQTGNIQVGVKSEVAIGTYSEAPSTTPLSITMSGTDIDPSGTAHAISVIGIQRAS
jgi:hypothetical protein